MVGPTILKEKKWNEIVNYKITIRHNNGLDMDYDGMGNQGRVPTPKVKSKNRKFKQRVK